MWHYPLLVLGSSIKKLCAVSLLKTGMNARLAPILRSRQVLTVLCFHRISDEHSPAYPPLPVAVFDQLLGYICDNYIVADINAIDHNPPMPQVILSFDDGYEDFYINALPILKKRKLPFVLSIIAGCAAQECSLWTQKLNKYLETFLDGRSLHYGGETYTITNGNIERIAVKLYKDLAMLGPAERYQRMKQIRSQCPVTPQETRFMNWEQIRACVAAGGSVFNHTYSHENMGMHVMPDMLLREINMSKQTIEECTGASVNGFTFPNSMYDNDSLEHVLDDDAYHHVFLVEHDINRIGGGEKLLKRLLMSKTSLSENIVTIESYLRHLKLKLFS